MGLSAISGFFGGGKFQSTHPVWDGTYRFADDANPVTDFNPPIPCGMGLRQYTAWKMEESISIHPSRVGWDHDAEPYDRKQNHFNPPIPCGMGPAKL